MADDQDQKDYQDYLEYQKYLGSQGQAQQMPTAGYQSPGGDSFSDRISDPNRWKAMFTGQGPAAPDVVQGSAPLAIPATAAPAVLGKLATYLGSSGAGPAAARVGTNTALGAAQGGWSGGKEGAIKGGVLGGSLGLLAEAISPIAGKTADWLQQKAMGMKKFLPGVGSTAIGEGVRGTKEGMKDKIFGAIEDLANQAGEKVQGLGSIDSAEAANPLADYADKLKVGDTVPEHSVREYSGAMDRAEGVASRDVTPANEAWNYAKKAGGAGYRNQKALENESAYLAQLEQQGYSNALKKAYADAHPGQTNDLADDFAKMSDLYKGSAALNQPETIRQGLPFTKLAGIGFGSALGGVPGAAAGYAATSAARSPLLQSYGATGLDILANTAVPGSAATTSRLVPSLFGQDKDKTPQK